MPYKSGYSGNADEKFNLFIGVLLIAGFGIVSTISLTFIVIHERKWQAWYIMCANNLCDKSNIGGMPRLFPKENLNSRDIWNQKIDLIGYGIIGMSCVMCSIWIILLFSLEKYFRGVW